MNDRKSIEEFPWDIDCDLLQYAGELRKKGFTSTLPAWYLTEEDLHFLPDAVLVWFKGFAAVLPDSRHCSTTLDIREFKIYNATVAKTSLKIASSSFSIYFAIMSVCLTFEN